MSFIEEEYFHISFAAKPKKVTKAFGLDQSSIDKLDMLMTQTKLSASEIVNQILQRLDVKDE